MYPEDMSDEQFEVYHARRAEFAARLGVLDRVYGAVHEAFWATVGADNAVILNWPPPGSTPLEVGPLRETLTSSSASLRKHLADLRAAVSFTEAEALQELGGHVEPKRDAGYQVDEAVSVFMFADVHSESASGDRERFRDAGEVLQREVRRLRVALSRAEAQAATSPVRGPEPSALCEGRDAGGRRYYLGGRPVSAGESLQMLTVWGWIPGRLETGHDGEPLLVLRPVPGSDYELALQATEDMRFAWPSDFER